MARKATKHISLEAAENVIIATGFADLIGFPLNRFITVASELAQCVGRGQEIQGRFLERMRKWLLYRGVIPAYVWVIENGSVIGFHSHIAVFVPSEHWAAFKRAAPAWVDGDVDKSTTNFQRTRLSFGISRLNGVKGRLRYMLKGCNNEAANLFSIRQSSQGTVIGRQCGTSENIGRTAQQRHSEISYTTSIERVDFGSFEGF